MAFMFKSVLNSIPKNRSQFVNDLEIPNIVLPPCDWKEPEECISETSDDSILVGSEDERGPQSSPSDLNLSRAMTDSEIDYDWYKTLRKSRFTDNWAELKKAMDAFPSDYLTSLYSYQDLYPAEETMTSYARERQRRYNDELKRRMDMLYDDCRAFEPDDPGLQALEDAVKDLKIKALDWDTKSS